ncbi:SMC-Scp complex subunit ScpB [Aerococcus christensenii]|uniref:Segregation and condensation protein B n=1 Tax=Aerococcus christensenii TaxID=87541 RepID=A0A120I8K6_9LACT|nr:SMC-Scp complex subunit ScpB [Aerococcus christensenii]AMB92063.1 segregation/condensation protein B [Aerococcus christensenii]KXB37473.1 segregation and condensation protein B [Aerococcus christensenii]MDK8233562.1 SMC-Scp complex subunit ScpB [Aerococcus christensenii]PKY92210.1 SMC-Scp complex subunit ScpB [Aerococcus christensenii]WEB70644.1 SMC-Scp complex subunit ScpB [Aerococcus christensenii]
MNLIGQCQSLLFVSGEEGLSLVELASLVDQPQEKVRYALLVLEEELSHNPHSAIRLGKVKDRYQLVTKSAFSETIKTYARSPFALKLSQQALETLAIIAYQQPITRLAIDEIRGVGSSAMIQRLMMHDLICEAGRQNSPGRPILYQVTDYFYQYFGLKNLSDLPDLETIKAQEEGQNQSDDLFQTELF